MDEDTSQRVGQRVKEEFRIGRTRLFRLKEEKKVRAEIADDRERLFSFFKLQGQAKQLDLTECLARLLMNFSKIASYRGVLEGYKLHTDVEKLKVDQSRYHLFMRLQEKPEATNKDLVQYLDVKNNRLDSLKTPKNDPLWAPLPEPWQKAFAAQKVEPAVGECWETALEKFPKLVMPYLSRTRNMANEARARNVLLNWPEIVKRHKRERR